MDTNYRKSRWVYVFKKGGNLALFHADTLKILYADFEVLQLLNLFSEPAILNSALSQFKNKTEVKNTFKDLVKEKFLVLAKEKELETFWKKTQLTVNRKSKGLGTKSRLNALRLVLTEKCPLNCAYCFVKREQSELKNMSEVTLIKALKMLVSLNEGKDVEVQFFGGEPLLRFDLIKRAVRYLDRCLDEDLIKRVFLGVTTNGVLITPQIAKYFAENNFLVSLSIDGWKEINDLNRKFPQGRGSFEYIVRALEMLKEANCQVGLLLTPSPQNIAVLDKICEYFITDLKCDFITVNTPQAKGGKWEIDGVEFSRQVYKMLNVAKKRGATINSFGSRILFALNNQKPQILSCSKFNESYMATVTTDGKVSPCIISWDLGENMIPMGEMSFSGPFRSWKIYQPFALKKCLNCAAMNICGGPCPLEIYKQQTKGERIDSERCRFFNNALKWAVWF